MTRLKLATKKLLAPLLFQGYPVKLQMERVYLWLDVLARTKDVPGDVIEMGVMHGGTSIMARKFLTRLGLDKDYWAYVNRPGFPGDSDIPEVRERAVRMGF